MKYFITLILLIAILSYGQIFEPNFPIAVNIALVFFIFLTAVILEYTPLKKNFESDFQMRSQWKIIGKFGLVSAVAWTTFWVLGTNNYRDILFFIIIFWIFPVAEIIIWFIYKREKPYILFIKENELTINSRWIQRRNLSELKEIRFDRISKILKLDFESNSTIAIKKMEYNEEDVDRLVEIIIEKSENNIFIPLNYKPSIDKTAVGTI